MYDVIDEAFSDSDEENDDTDNNYNDDDNQANQENEQTLIQRDTKVLPGYDLLVEILKRCGYFLSSWSLESQVIVVDTIIAALRRLANHRSILLPNVHNIWP